MNDSNPIEGSEDRQRSADSATTRQDTGDLLAAASSGDQDAWYALYVRYRKVLKAVLRQRMGQLPRNRYDTEDLLQSTFLTAWRSLDDFEYRGPDSFRRWITRILSHKVSDKRRYHTQPKRDVAREDPIGADENDLEARMSETPSVILSRIEGHRRLLEALTELPLADQEIVGLRFFDKRTWPEIAEKLGVGEATARRRLLETLEHLMRKLI